MEYKITIKTNVKKIAEEVFFAANNNFEDDGKQTLTVTANDATNECIHEEWSNKI